MIRVAFFIHFNQTWLGGLNVILNLINFISTKKNKFGPKLKIIIFTNSKKKLRKFSISKKVEIIEDASFYDQSIFYRIIDKISLILFNKTVFLEKFLLKNKIDYISHTNFVTGNNSSSKSIVWIPDFQYLYFPELFSLKYRFFRSLNLKIYAKCAHKILLSSYTAKGDLKKILKILDGRILVNKFIFERLPKNKLKKFSYLKKKYKLPKKFFYLPNQYWEHKNHKVVIDAIKKIKNTNRFNDICVCSTGVNYDYRNPNHFNDLMKTIKQNKLDKNYKYLGVVPYTDVLSLIYHSSAVVNPSLFEGWSSTVEQAKAYNKIIILSNIKVHLEQAPERAHFFDPYSSDSLKKIFLNINYRKINKKNRIFNKNYKKTIKDNIQKYLENYYNIFNY